MLQASWGDSSSSGDQFMLAFFSFKTDEWGVQEATKERSMEILDRALCLWTSVLVNDPENLTSAHA